MAAIIATATPQFRSPAVNRAKGEYDRAMAKAKAEYDKAVAAAGERYAGVLHAEILKATQAGELDNALSYKKEKERVTGDLVARDLALNGAWIMDDNNGRVRWYVFAGDRAAYGWLGPSGLTGRIRQAGDAYVIPFKDGTTVVVRPRGETLDYVLYASEAAKRSNRPGSVAVGRKATDFLLEQK